RAARASAPTAVRWGYSTVRCPVRTAMPPRWSSPPPGRRMSRRRNELVGSRRITRRSGPVRFATKQKPHRPGIAPPLGLPPDPRRQCVFRLTTRFSQKESSMTRSSRPRFQPRLEVLEDRCTPSTMSDFVNVWEVANGITPPNAAPAVFGLLNAASTQATAAASASQNADSRVVPFKITGGGYAPQGLPEFPGGTVTHTATGNATQLGKYSGNGLFQLLSLDLATLTGTFEGSFTFVAANADKLVMNYGANPSNPGQFALLPAGNGQFYAVFVAEFTPDPAQSTG